MAELTVADILRKVQRIQIVANRTVNDLFAGQYRSVFRGRGMEFDEVRPYQPGDDVRTIDWNVTARTGECFIKRFCEERELTVLFLVDVSASGMFGSLSQSKLDIVVEMAALLMFSALKNNDKVGLITFCDDVIDFVPPRKGKPHVLRLIRQLVDVHPVVRPTALDRPLEFLNRVQKRRAVVFLVSDFLGDLPQHLLGITHQRHDLTAITVTDRREAAWEDVGFILLRDAETGDVAELDSRHPRVREWFGQQAAKRREKLSRLLRKLGIDQLSVDTGGDYARTLRQFFSMRERRAQR
ncbi:MAG: DUF58 domain-containing protein [Pirellulaceae bacterium]